MYFIWANNTLTLTHHHTDLHDIKSILFLFNQFNSAILAAIISLFIFIGAEDIRYCSDDECVFVCVWMCRLDSCSCFSQINGVYLAVSDVDKWNEKRLFLHCFCRWLTLSHRQPSTVVRAPPKALISCLCVHFVRVLLFRFCSFVTASRVAQVLIRPKIASPAVAAFTSLFSPFEQIVNLFSCRYFNCSSFALFIETLRTISAQWMDNARFDEANDERNLWTIFHIVNRPSRCIQSKCVVSRMRVCQCQANTEPKIGAECDDQVKKKRKNIVTTMVEGVQQRNDERPENNQNRSMEFQILLIFVSFSQLLANNHVAVILTSVEHSKTHQR